MKKMRAVLSLFGLFYYWTTFGMIAQAAENIPRITGLYSDMWYHMGRQSITGTEIFIMQNQLGYVAVVQCAKGSAGTPFVVPVTLKGNTIAFEIPAREDNLCCPGRFTATIVEKQLKGQFERCNNEAIVLTRKNSYWQ